MSSGKIGIDTMIWIESQHVSGGKQMEAGQAERDQLTDMCLGRFRLQGFHGDGGDGEAFGGRLWEPVSSRFALRICRENSWRSGKTLNHHKS